MEEKCIGIQTAMFDQEKTYAWHGKRQDHIQRKYKAIKKRFKEIYEGQRIRYDDAIKILTEEYFLAEITIERILRK